MLQEFIKSYGVLSLQKLTLSSVFHQALLPLRDVLSVNHTKKLALKNVLIVEEPMAAAIGAGLPTTTPTGCMIVDIGGGTSEVAVVSLGGIVSSRSVRCAGDAFDASIINFIKKKYNLLIGERTAETIKIEIGSAFPSEWETMEIKGRNLLNGLQENITISSAEIRDALVEPLSKGHRRCKSDS